MSKREKRQGAGQSIQPSSHKVVRGGETARSLHTQLFRWTTQFCDLEGPFGWTSADHDTLLRSVLPKLQHFESQTWGQIETQSDGHHHLIEVSTIESSARERLNTIELTDIENIFSLRLEGAERVWGVRAGPVFQALWYDPAHQVCPSTKDRGDKRKARLKEQRNRQSGRK